MGLTFPPPCELGAPAKFSSWRPGQEAAFTRAFESDRRFLALCQPTGSGKSVTFMTLALAKGGRTLILTSNRGQQDQLERDFAEIGLVDIRGKNNYVCANGLHPHQVTLWKMSMPRTEEPTCEDGADLHCSHLQAKSACDACPYRAQKTRAMNAELVLSNYSYNFAINKWGDGLGKFDRLICDEAHEIERSELPKHLRVQISDDEVRTKLRARWPVRDKVKEWRAWAKEQWVAQEAYVEEKGISLGLRELRSRRSLVARLHTLSEMQTDWISERYKGKWRRGFPPPEGWQFEPLWVAPYAEKALFRGIPEVILSSATLIPKHLELLGIEEDQYDYQETPHTFPVRNRRVIYVPSIRNDHRATDAQLGLWLNRMDRIHQDRRDRKGIVHSVSYTRQRLIGTNSKFAGDMVLHETDSTRDTVQDFKTLDAPAILVSPAITTGWDFPEAATSYQIISKIPFGDQRTQAAKKRAKVDKSYGLFQAMTTVVQMAGRLNRSAPKFAETFIVDDHWTWFRRKGKKFAPRWFWKAVIAVRGVPPPPPKKGPGRDDDED